MPFKFGLKGLTRATLTAQDEKQRKEIERDYDARIDKIDSIVDDWYK